METKPNTNMKTPKYLDEIIKTCLESVQFTFKLLHSCYVNCLALWTGKNVCRVEELPDERRVV